MVESACRSSALPPVFLKHNGQAIRFSISYAFTTAAETMSFFGGSV